MSITANLTDPNGMNLRDRFVAINDNYKDYVKELKKEFPTQSGGSDHFIGTFNEIDSLVKLYESTGSIPQVMNAITKSKVLCSWVSSVFCAIMYGFDGNNSLSIQKIPFLIHDAATDTKTPVPNVDYLRVWKDKFDIDGKGKTNDSDPSYTVDGTPSPFKDEKYSLNIISFADGAEGTKYPNILGCFSSEYFVIPLKAFRLGTYEDNSPWKMKYFELISHRENFARYIDTLNVRQKVLLRLSALRTPASVPSPIKLIKDIILQNIDVTGYGVDLADASSIPSFKTICQIPFYKTESVLDLDNLVSKTIHMGIDVIGDRYVYRSTYPITNVLVTGLKNGQSRIDNIGFNVKCENGKPNAVEYADFSFIYHDKILFLAAPNAAVVDGAVESKEYYYPVNKRYEKSDIVNIRKMQTICMFPNISAEYEHRCKRFTYFSLDQSFILRGSINGVRSVDIGNGLFKGVIDNTGNSQNIICKDKSDGIYGKKKAPDGSPEGFTYIFTTVATVPEHFINVCDMSGASCGYALNLRCEDKDVPALLESPMNSKFEIKLVSPQGVSKNDMYAYVDFGSSTSCMKYSIAGGNLIEDDIVLDKCTVRKFLTEYLDDNDYKLVINDPVLNNRSKFMSISTLYDNKIGVGDYSVYRDGWTPIVKNLSGYEQGISVSASNKTKIVKNPQVESANIIVNNICYTLACSAVARNCNEVYVVPTLPSKEYLSNIKQIWSRAISNVNDIFDIKINNVLETDDIQYLFESIAVSNGMPGQQTGTLMVSIDMGDGTTDMSAVILEAMAGSTTISHPCGQASVEYAGKDLIKQTIRDIIEHVSKKTAEDMLKGEGAFNSLFTPNDQSNEGIKYYKGKVDKLINEFFGGGNTLNPPKDEAWQNKVMDILDVSNLREGIDQKVAANFILRYAILMPVIRDFVRTAIKLAGDRFNEENGSIIIDFVGGSSKGLKLLDAIDARHCAGQLVEQYFANEFAGLSVNIRGINANAAVQNKDGKDILIDGLKDLKIQHTPVGERFSITTDGGALVPPETQKQLDKEWRNIDTKAENLGLDVHINALNIPFKTVEECAAFVSGNGKFANAVDASITKNREIIDDPASYYKDYSSKDNPDVPVIEFTDYFNNEIFKKLIDNDDNNLDAIESLIENFVNHASGDMKSAIKRELLKNANDNSFYRATHSSIYPEMIKDTIFMFTVSKLLSEFHRGYNDHQIISDANQVGGYQFGG